MGRQKKNLAVCPRHQSNHASPSISSSTKGTTRENEEEGRDGILRLLRDQVALNELKKAIQAKDEKIQELDTNAKLEQVRLQEEATQLAEYNSALRNNVSMLEKDVLHLQRYVDGLKELNDGESSKPLLQLSKRNK